MFEVIFLLLSVVECRTFYRGPQRLLKFRGGGGYDRGKEMAEITAAENSSEVLDEKSIIETAAENAEARGEKKMIEARFPDGSSYRGETFRGQIDGRGEWRSSSGEIYLGEFRCDMFDGYGRFSDANGNTYEGCFSSGAYHGCGTYFHADGRAEVGKYVKGRDTGTGARWSIDRTLAWEMLDGKIVGSLSLEKASCVAKKLGLEVPDSIFSLVETAVSELNNSSIDLIFESLLSHGDLVGFSSEGYDLVLVAHSTNPVVSEEACDAIVAESEAQASLAGGWSTKRHTGFPTTDIPVAQLPGTLRWMREILLPKVAFPFLGNAFIQSLPMSGPDPIFRVSDAFVVKYNATAGQRLLASHRDSSVFSFNIALNNLSEYQGGGTGFAALCRQQQETSPSTDSKSSAIMSPKGHILAHSSALLHSGSPIIKGVRYILVVFVSVSENHTEWGNSFCNKVKNCDP